MVKHPLFLVFVLVGPYLIPFCYGQKTWQMAKAPLMTPWAEEIDPAHPLPAYPRPQMVRSSWLNLNGLWGFKAAQKGESLPMQEAFTEQILIPFPWESAISGIHRQLPSQQAWYHRTFQLADSWKTQRTLLHFGAVDWHSKVFVNGRFVGEHKGGYDAFYFDITDYLKADVDQEIHIWVYDPGNDEGIAYGKQNNARFEDPQRFTYSPSSGIWQTVWLEAVPDTYLTHLKLVPDIEQQSIRCTINASTLGGEVRIEVLDQGKVVGSANGPLNASFAVPVPQPHLWTPEDPFLYDVNIQLLQDNQVIDEVKSYIGMRSISLGTWRNVQRILLNGEFLFQMGTLDQGFWPDGLHTAPTDEALRWDIAQTKAMGFNMIRKHIKVEPARWYYWCDKMGVLVWQDMPSTFKKRTEAEKIQFESELQHMIKQHWNHPCIVNWIVFNEHWGLYDVERLTEMVIALDPSRLVTGNSGIDAGKPDVDYEVGHIKDNHHYRPPTSPYGNNKRAVVCGEYGAIGYLPEGHVWDADGPWVHFNYEGLEAATKEYERFIQMILEFQQEGLSGAVYTQWTDVENEMNGIYSYDRKLLKLDEARLIEANQSTYASDYFKQVYETDNP